MGNKNSMNNKMGIIVNRLTIGLIFAFIYKFLIAASAWVTGVTLAGDIDDLYVGIIDRDVHEGALIVIWWLISTIIISVAALVLVRFRRLISPYKGEKNINVPPKITVITAVSVGTVIIVLFFVTHLVLGLFVDHGSETDILTIYESALHGDFAPLLVSIIFSIIAGFIVVGVSNRADKVRRFAKNIGLSDITLLDMQKEKDEDITHTSDTAGLDPSTLIHVGKKKVDRIKISLIQYDEESHMEQYDMSLEECMDMLDDKMTKWINISGIHDPDTIKYFGDHFSLHPLIQSDIMNTELRPMINFDSKNIFIILKIPNIDKDGSLSIEQISVVIGKGYVLTFQETDDDVFDNIRKRLKESVGIIRSMKSDYLGYAIIDSSVDHFFVVLEKIGQITETVEEDLMLKPNPKILETIRALKRKVLTLRRSIWPLREIIDNLERTDSGIVLQGTKMYIRDVYTHTVQIIDTIEGLRDVIGGMLDTYLSSVSNKMNEVMKTLTVIASIFIPGTFVAGIYGMNFSYMPELEWEGSYFVLITIMFLIIVTMVIWFKKKQWM